MVHRPPARARRTAWRATAVALLTLVAGAGLGDAPGSARTSSRRAPHVDPLRFGIYPGGSVGTIGPGATPRPMDAAKRLDALRRLRGRHPFVLHLYASYTGSRGPSAATQIRRDLTRYERNRFQIELVLCYRPRDGGTSSDVRDFARFAADAVASLSASHDLVSLQITNEANVAGAPDATDGSYADATDALVAGALAAKRTARRLGAHWLRVGFNWAYATGPGQAWFWRNLHRLGGTAFARAVDWVGLDAYPGTWGPPIDITRLGPSTAATIRNDLRSLRLRYMRLAGLSRRVAIHVSENGYPTGPGRTPAMQATALRAAITAVRSVDHAYNVTDYRWFDLRDADSTSPSFEDRYGLLSDDYAPKPAFGVYRTLIAAYSGS